MTQEVVPMTIWKKDGSVERLKMLWKNDDHSADQIASLLTKEFGMDVTRSAVLGKAHRLKLESKKGQEPRARPPSKKYNLRKAPQRVPTPSVQVVKAPPIVTVIPPKLVAPEPLTKKGMRVTIHTLSDRTCKWPIGNAGDKEFCFCGHVPRNGSAYCEYHARLAFQPLLDRRHRKVDFGEVPKQFFQAKRNSR